MQLLGVGVISSVHNEAAIRDSLFLVLEYASGGSLSQVVSALSKDWNVGRGQGIRSVRGKESHQSRMPSEISVPRPSRETERLIRTARPSPTAPLAQAHGLLTCDLVAWCEQLATVMASFHAHSPPLVHRDIKLDNILLSLREWRRNLYINPHSPLATLRCLACNLSPLASLPHSSIPYTALPMRGDSVRSSVEMQVRWRTVRERMTRFL